MISGVYAIRDRKSKRVLYVGESHTGRLRETLARHLRYWEDRGEPREYYERADVEVAWRESAEPLKDEAALIRHYRPRDNLKGLFDDLEGQPRPTRSEYDDADISGDVTLIPFADDIPF